MPLYVVDDGCIYETIANRVRNNSPLEEVTKLRDLISLQSEYIKNALGAELDLDDAYSEYLIDGKLVIAHLSFPTDVTNRDDFLSLLLTLNKLNTYDPLENFDEDIYRIDGYTASSYIQNQYAGVVTLRDISKHTWFNSLIHKVCVKTEDSRVIFCNEFFAENNDYAQAFNTRNILWPNLYFNEELTSRFSNLGLDEIKFKDLLFRHLNYLDQYGQHHFAQSNSPRDFINIAASNGVEISPESVKTHRNSKAMRQRKVILDGHEIVCEWHTKLTYDCGRVHVFFNINSELGNCIHIGNKLVIGIFVDHLLT